MLRRFQFSLRALLVIMLVVALAAAAARYDHQRKIDDARERVAYWQQCVEVGPDDDDRAMVHLIIEEATLADLIGSR